MGMKCVSVKHYSSRTEQIIKLLVKTKWPGHFVGASTNPPSSGGSWLAWGKCLLFVQCVSQNLLQQMALAGPVVD